jgi:HlyD family secretion protein
VLLTGSFIASCDIDQVYAAQTATMGLAVLSKTYYAGRVILKQELAKIGAAKLVPGMAVEVFIKT